MTDDIVARLRAPAFWMSCSWDGHEGENDVPVEAADEISRLRADLAAERTQREFGQELAKELQTDLDAAKERASKYQRIAAELTDKLNGTPCAEIRWQQEREELHGLLREVRNHVMPFSGDLLDRIDATLKGYGNE